MLPSDKFIHKSGPAMAVHGLPEETVAMLFGKYSRSKESIIDSLNQLLADTEVTGDTANLTTEKVQQFHKRITIGYGHKSVGDHAMVHFAVEGVSAIAERDYMSARLMAATSKSTRYVNFRDAGFVTPDEWPVAMREGFAAHCEELLIAYEKITPLMIEVVRKIHPYLEQDGWKSQGAWETATEKRALDAVRDVLPASIKTSFGMSMSATACREMLDKRATGGCWQPIEISSIGDYIRTCVNAVMPTLLPLETRYVSRGVEPMPRVGDDAWLDYDPNLVLERKPQLELTMAPNMKLAQKMTGMPSHLLVQRWIMERGRHMPPDRTSEYVVIGFKGTIPFAIQRELGRHRMATQHEGQVIPMHGYGCDPLLFSTSHKFDSRAGIVAACVRDALFKADGRIRKWSSVVPNAGLQYASPLATMVPVRYMMNLREFVHLVGLRTTPQAHPVARQIVQGMAKLVRAHDPMHLGGLIDVVTNWEDIIVGRPG